MLLQGGKSHKNLASKVSEVTFCNTQIPEEGNQKMLRMTPSISKEFSEILKFLFLRKKTFLYIYLV